MKSGAPPDEHLATVTSVRGVRRLTAICPHAEAAGLHPGQTLTQARALCPALIVAESEPEEDAAALAALAQWATSYTPLAAPNPPDTLWLDIAGCAHLFGGEQNLAETLTTRLHRWGLDARWAIAATTGAAHALAHYAPGTMATNTQAAALAPLPIEALRLDPTHAAALRRLGLKTIAALARLPRAELAARFGKLPGLRLDQAHGATTEPIAWPPLPPDWSETERLPEPILTTEACTTVLAALTQRLCARLAAQRQGLRQCVAAFQRLDGSIHTLAVATALPVHDQAYLLKLLTERLQGLDPGFGIETVTLAAPATEAAETHQQTLAGNSNQTQQRLAQLVDALTNRLRPGRLWRIAPRDSHIPERASQPAPPLPAKKPAPGLRLRPPQAPWPDSSRPIRLLKRPERIDVTAPLPDDPPVQFRWRGALHRVRAATGPERIAEEWWTNENPEPRDYYQVEDTDGARYWMFRAEMTWFLHGLFG